jgi:predicted esterase
MFETFEAFNQQVMMYYEAKDFAAALDLLEREGEHFPSHAPMIAYLTACMAARVNQPERAEDILASALQRGIWFDEMLLRQTPSWASLQGRPTFERIAAANIEQARQYVGVPRRYIAEPADEHPSEQGYPVLIALHGNLDTGEAALRAWQPATKQGWLVAALQSSQVHMTDGYVWDDTDLATQEILHHYVELAARYPIDTTRTVLLGFSMGASVALQLALADAIPMCGFILLGPGAPDEPWMPTIPEQRESPHPLRGVVLYGEREPNRNGIDALLGMLRGLGIPMHLDLLAGLSHEYPDDDGLALQRALAFIGV